MEFEYIFLPEIASTQKYAISAINSGDILQNSIIYTKNQTNGIGRSGSKWHSAMGNLAVSFVILQENSSEIALASIKAGLSVAKSLEVLGISNKVTLKWPNDIFCNNQKIGGIIVNIEQKDNIKYCIIGIGLNLISHPEAEMPYPISNILKEFGVKITPNEIISQVAQQLPLYLEKNEVIDEYKKIAFGFGEKIQLQDGRLGILQDFTQNGSAVAALEGGEVVKISSGSLEFLNYVRAI